MTPQAKIVLSHLKSGKHITALEALGVYGIFRLAARILEVRAEGYVVKTQHVYDARRKQYARYSIVQPTGYDVQGKPVYLDHPLPVPVYARSIPTGVSEQAAA